MTQPHLAVIIVSWNVRALLDRCLAALRADLETCTFSSGVWVVDNASNDGSADLVRQQHPWVELRAMPENLGFVRGNNLILEELLPAPPTLLWLLNPDTEVQPGATATLARCFEQHPCAGLIGPRLLNPDGSLQHSAFRFPGLVQPLADLGLLPPRCYETALNGRYAPALYATGNPFRVAHPLGAAMMARGTAVAEIGPLDEGFFMYCEEIDWAWRFHKAGWEVWLEPAAQVVHHGGASTGQARPQMTAHLWESRARLYRKHRSPLTRRLVGALVRRHFARQQAASPEWAEAHRRIIAAWGT